MRTSVWASVRDSAWTSVRDSVMDSVRASVRQQVRKGWGNHFLSYYQAPWCSFESFLHQICGLQLEGDLTQRAESLRNTTLACCGWYPSSRFAMVCNRPEHIDREDGRLHSSTRLAIQWRDGWGLAFWRGIRIPNEWVLRKPPTAKRLLSWESIEQRRAGFELIGWDKLMEELDFKVLDSHPNPEIGVLLEVDLPGSGREKFIKVLCGTGRQFILPVPLECSTALEAQAWSYGLDDINLLPEIRT